MKQLGISLVWILLSGALIAPIGSMSAFAIDATSTTVISSQNSSTFSQPVTFTAVLTPLTATGTVVFNDTSVTPPAILGTSTISGGLATFSISSLSIGNHNIVAKYLGDASNFPSTSGVLTQTVDKIGTTTTISSSLNPSEFDQSVTFTATVVPAFGSLIPTGTIQFLVDGTATGSPVTLTSSQATFVLSSLSVGTHVISATYSSDPIFDASTDTLTQTIHQIGTSVDIISSQNPSVLGQSITFTATVLPISATGTIQFNDTSVTPPAILGTSTISDGKANFTTSSLSTGSHNIVVKYLGDATDSPSTSTPLTQVVNQIHITSTTTLLNANVTSITFSKIVNFTAIVTPNNATGTLQFLLNGTSFGSPVALLGSHATMITSSLPIGTDVIAALYPGNSNFSPSSSNSVTVKVTSTATSQNVTQGKVTGGGHIGKGINFGFEVNADGEKIKGTLQYNDKTSKIKLHSNNVTSLAVDQNLTQASFGGSAKVNGKSGVTFFVTVTDPDKTGKHDTFSITITNSSGSVIYQNSGTVKGHIEIHAADKDNDNDTKQIHEKSAADGNGKGKNHLSIKPIHGKNNSQGKNKHKG